MTVTTLVLEELTAKARVLAENVWEYEVLADVTGDEERVVRDYLDAAHIALTEASLALHRAARVEDGVRRPLYDQIRQAAFDLAAGIIHITADRLLSSQGIYDSVLEAIEAQGRGQGVLFPPILRGLEAHWDDTIYHATYRAIQAAKAQGRPFPPQDDETETGRSE